MTQAATAHASACIGGSRPACDQPGEYKPQDASGQTALYAVTQANNDVVVTLLHRDLVYPNDINATIAAITALADTIDEPRITIDLARLEHVSLQFFRRLLALQTIIDQRRGRLRLAHAQGQVRSVLRVTRLDRKLRLEAPGAKARTSLRSPSWLRWLCSSPAV